MLELTIERAPEIRPCTRLIGQHPCGATSRELMGVTETLALEMPEVPEALRPRQFCCTVGHTTTDHVQPPLPTRHDARGRALKTPTRAKGRPLKHAPLFVPDEPIILDPEIEWSV